MRSALVVLIAAIALVGCQNKKTEPKREPDPSTLRSEGPVSTLPTDAAAAVQAPEPPGQERPPPPPLPDPPAGKRTDLTAAVGSAWRAGIGDIDGDGDRELVIVDAKVIRVLDATGREVTSTPVTSGILQLLVADLDGDKRAEVYAGWGQTRDHMDATARITVHRFMKGKLVEEVMFTPSTSRNEVTALVPMYDTKELLVGYFDSKYMVTTAVLTKGAQGWTSKTIASLRTATSYARGDLDGDGKPELVVGRVYGDDKGIDGDAFVLGPDSSRKVIPSTRGLRSVAIIDTDGDNKGEVFMGDGWHQNYGANARGLLTRAKLEGGTFKTELVEDTQGQYEIMETQPAKLDGKLALVTHGSHYVRVFWRAGAAWKALTIAGASRDVAIGDLDGQPGDEVVVIGDKSEVINLKGALQ